MTATMDELRLDGNASAGLLQEIFAFEITSAMAVCDGCGKGSPVGTLMLYGHGMGAVLRCPGCGQIMMVVTDSRGEWCLDLRGVRVMRSAAATTSPQE